MCVNAETIEKIEAKKEELFAVQSVDYIHFQLSSLNFVKSKDLKKKDKVFLDHIEVDPAPLFRHLGINNKFLTASKRLSEADWEMLMEKIKLVGKDKVVYAEDDTDCLSKFYFSNRAAQTKPMEYERILNSIITVLSKTDVPWELENMGIVNKNMRLTLIDKSIEIDVFETKVKDFWKVGVSLEWSKFSYGVRPYFYRKICRNGQYKNQLSDVRYMSKRNFNMPEIEKSLFENLTSQHMHMKQKNVLQEACRKHALHNASIDEFLVIHDYFSDNLESERKIKESIFPIAPLCEKYAVDVRECPKLWKQTADSGKKSYDLLNDFTYVLSHPDEYPLPDYTRERLAIQAGDYLFKEHLDLSLIAPSLDN